MNRVILLGDELGLNALYKSVKCNQHFIVAGVICHSGRKAAEEVATAICSELGCALIKQPLRANEPEYREFIKRIKSTNAEFAVCNSYDMILQREVLEIFPKGIYNMHSALLPRYRGGNVLNWVIINGEKETGISLHLMEETVDTGPIVLQKKVRIDYEDTALTLRKKLCDAGDSLLSTFWKLVEEDKIGLFPQNEEDATYVPRRKPDDGYFEWSWETERIYNLIRALVSPWPGAFYIENGEKKVIDQYMTYNEVLALKAMKEHSEVK